jgi:spoIIIJ-associated protein
MEEGSLTGTPRAIEVEAESIDEAIDAALATLGIAREQAEVEILQDAKRGLLGFGGQKARVRVAQRGAITPPSSADGVSPTGEAGDAAEVLRQLLVLMDVPGEVQTAAAEEPGQTWLRISSEAGGLLIGRHGQTLDALEYLVNRIVSRQEERGGRILLDAEGYRERRQNELREMASRMAARARQTSKPQAMNPMNPRERRIVHVALNADSSVTTGSVGDGYLRRVVIYPAR